MVCGRSTPVDNYALPFAIAHDIIAAVQALLVFQSEFQVVPAIWWIPRFLRSCFWVIAKVTGKCRARLSWADGSSGLSPRIRPKLERLRFRTLPHLRRTIAPRHDQS
ncbi:hypothetical protein FJTKL_04010 [Diaporthe vaccinii]|uniref:Uncharacterized protein n=1 Tax=Diaporthe vaccinii TaxID=105482 RepID=A0ABR4DWL6_9PEZI